jgi:hypothetical protein
MSNRKDRLKQFKTQRPGPTGSLSTNLVDSARALLRQSLDDRRRGVVRAADNHYSFHSPAVITLVVTAFEAWLNECISILAYVDDLPRDFADKPITKKYYEIPKRVTDSTVPDQPDLQFSIDLRHEMVHFLPRVLRETDPGAPTRLVHLADQGFLLDTPTPRGEFPLEVRLSTYRLAYWACETTEIAVAAFMKALGSKKEYVVPTGSNFRLFHQDVCPPSELGDYDTQYGLT